MRRVLLANDSTLRVVRIPGEHGVFSFLEDLSASDARRYLEEYASDHMAITQLRMALSEDSFGMPVQNLDDAEVLDEVAHRISMGHLWIAEELPEPQPDIPEPDTASSSSAAPPPELPRSKKLTWIEFQVIWESTAKPVKNVRLVVRTPDGVENYHDTNSEGKVRIDELEPGTCDVRCDLKAARLADTLSFVGMGSASGEKGSESPEQTSTASALRIALVEAHKVKKGESILSLATGIGMTWQDLSKFNWGTDVPNEINKHLRDEVGCTKKTKDGYNYMFDDSDNPGIMYLPRKWVQSGLATGGTYTIRVRRPAPVSGFALIVPVEMDPDDDPNQDDQVRIRTHDGSFESVLSSSDGNVAHDEERRLLLYNFGKVPTAKYVVSLLIADQWVDVLYGLEITPNGASIGGRSVGENLDELHLGVPDDVEGTRPEDRHDLGDPVEPSDIFDEDVLAPAESEESA